MLGQVLADRFVVDAFAGEGGMARVYRAKDLVSGAAVAVKIAESPNAVWRARLAKEISAIQGLRHPAIVSYVSHGVGPQGEPFLVEEWLEGVDLQSTLERGRLELDAALALARRVSSALNAVHRAGMIHRDVKPSNILLVGGDPAEAKLLDFGIVRIPRPEGVKTGPGALIGTPGFIAPEQARGETTLDGRVDVFALGCVLYECLAGRPAFNGEHPVAILTRVLMEDPPRLRSLRAETPLWVDELVAAMLQKAPADRPDSDAVVAALDARQLEWSGPVSSPAPIGISDRERVLVSAAVAKPREAISERGDTTVSASNRELAPARWRRVLAATVAVGDALVAQVRAALLPLGARVESLVDGTVVAVIGGDDGAPGVAAGALGDPTARAVRAAEILRAQLVDYAVAVATDRSDASAPFPAGAAVDKAISRLAPGDAGAAIPVDELTAGLLEGRLEVVRGPNGPAVPTERRAEQTGRRLLGKMRAFVGRRPELTAAVECYERAMREGRSGALLITSEAGVGKSRLRFELLREMWERGHRPQVLAGFTDPVGGAAPLGLVAQAALQSAGIRPEDDLEVQRSKLQLRVGRSLGSDRARLAASLGDIVGLEVRLEEETATPEPLAQLDQMRRGWLEMLRTELAIRPVVLVLEDLQWADGASLDFVDAALGALSSRPFFVVATARPEIEARFPDLWRGRDIARLALAPLTDRACVELCRSVLGDAIPPARIETIARMAGGNAFHLEELLRASAAGAEAADTVLALLGKRIEALPSLSRKILRAASAFGTSFRRDGISSLLGPETAPSTLDAELERLVEGEWIHRTSAQPDAFEFHHGLLRDAAYPMLTEADRVRAHRLVAAWLVKEGEPDPLRIADHLHLAGEAVAAIAFDRAAAERALRAGDYRAALDRAERGIRSETEGPELGLLFLTRAEAYHFLGEHDACEASAHHAVELLEPGSTPWFSAISAEIHAAATKGGLGAVRRAAAEIRTLVVPSTAAAAATRVAAQFALHFYTARHGAEAEEMYRLATGWLAAVEGPAPGLHGALEEIVAWREYNAGHLEAMLAAYERAIAFRTQSEDGRHLAELHHNMAVTLVGIGDFEGAERHFEASREQTARFGLEFMTGSFYANLVLLRWRQGRYEEARQAARVLDGFARVAREARTQQFLRIYVALVEMAEGDYVAARAAVRSSYEITDERDTARAYAFAVDALCELEVGRPTEALARAKEAAALADLRRPIEEGEAMVDLALGRSLEACGHADEAAEAYAIGAQRVVDRAASLAPHRQHTYRTALAENAELLRRAGVTDG